MKVSVTEKQIFQRCRRKWWLREKENLVPKVDTGAKNLWLGTGIHFCLMAFYNSDDEIKKAIKISPIKNRKQSALASKNKQLWDLADWYLWCKENPNIDFNLIQLLKNRRDSKNLASIYQLWLEYYKITNWINGISIPQGDFEEIESLGLSMIIRYVENYQDDFDKFKILHVEEPFDIYIHGTKVRLCGTPDLIVRDKFGDFWVIDHKTAKSFGQETDFEFDDQITAYMWAIREVYKIKTSGIIYNQILKEKPESPKVNKDGTPSKDKRQKTTPQLYMETVRSLGLDEKEWWPIAQQFKDKEWFRRVEITRTQKQVDNFYKENKDLFRDMYSKHTKIYPNYSRDCAWFCPYTNLCLAERAGDDVEYLKENMFVVADKRYPDED